MSVLFGESPCRGTAQCYLTLQLHTRHRFLNHAPENMYNNKYNIDTRVYNVYMSIRVFRLFHIHIQLYICIMCHLSKSVKWHLIWCLRRFVPLRRVLYAYKQ